ncbi:MAG TPA: hypothetical protein VN181_00745, partial [Thermoanaerobaculia bacterium]|nr:hypothetical protein [Thermoanaerobaculia bacterium]
SAPGTDEILLKYHAGAIGGTAEQLVAVFRDRESYASGAQRFVREHQWSDTLAPLREFCRAPRIDRNKDAFAIRTELPPLTILDRIRRRMKLR